METSGPIHILIAEDDDATAEGLSQLLTSQGYQTSITQTVVDGLVLARSRKIDLLISDLQLKDGTGIELMTRLRQLQSVPGILISGYPKEDYWDRSRRAGFDCFLVKPVCIDVLSDRVSLALDRTNDFLDTPVSPVNAQAPVA